MKTHTKIIFWLILLFVGLQWIGDPVEVRLTSNQSQGAGWHDSDANGPDNSHHFGSAALDQDLTPLNHVAIVPPAMQMAGPAFLGWLLPASDTTNLRPPAISHRTPRAPPAV